MNDFLPEGAEHQDFAIGTEFLTETGQWRCTDIGTRTIIAIKIDEYDDASWYNGPPYAVVEHCFDEDSIQAVTIIATDNG
jgi:hypothetical protein